jgi:hypothetical protein
MRGPIKCVAVTCVLVTMLPPGVALAGPSSALNFSTQSNNVVCGIAPRIHGTHLDPGVGAPLNGLWPGLQCAAEGIPRPAGAVGDPFVQLGQGRAGRARVLNLSQNDLSSGATPVALPAGSTWRREGITCRVGASSVSCGNGHGHGFTLATDHLHLF